MKTLLVGFRRGSGDHIVGCGRVKSLGVQIPIVQGISRQSIALESWGTWNRILLRRSAIFERLEYCVASRLRDLAETAGGPEKHDSGKDNPATLGHVENHATMRVS
jgi:hypothetical protein